MEKGKMEILGGVAALLANAHTPPPTGEFYTFDGDLCQMAKAAEVAQNLGIKIGVVGGIPYVESKDEYDKVVKYIVDNQVEGYWNYNKK